MSNVLCAENVLKSFQRAADFLSYFALILTVLTMEQFLSICLCFVGLAIVTSVATSCNSNQFHCDDGTCIEKFRWCDSVVDCDDDSDENYCRKRWWNVSDPNKCKIHHFKCADGVCIPQEGFCDGIPSCPDRSDEENCPEITSEEITSTSHVTTDWATEKDVNVTLPTTLNYTSELTPEPHVLTTKQYSPEVHDLTTELTSVSLVFELKDDENVLRMTSSTPVEIQPTPKVPKQNSPTAPNHNFNHLIVKSFREQKERALNWLLSKRNEDFGWGEDTPRSLVAIYLSKSDSVVNKTEDLMMSQQLHLQLFVALMKNATSPLPICELALFVNALMATCSNPRNFHGLDLISSLRQRVDVAQQNGHYISPLVYLTLCLGNETTYDDLKKIQEIMASKVHLMDRMDIQALTTLAASCIVKIPKYSNSYLRHEASRKLLQKIMKNGLPHNIYEVSLLTQALNEVQMNEVLWNRQRAMKIILQSQDKDGSFGDILSTYFVLPILSGKSLSSLNSHCETNNDQTDTPNTNGERNYIQYSLYFGSPVEVSQTIMLKVAKGTNFLEIMRLAQKANPLFKFEIDYSQNTPTVYALGGVTNDVERGMFWSLYISKKDIKTNTTKPMMFLGDVRTLIPETGEENIFWFKSLE